MDKRQLAKLLNFSVRQIENMMANQTIPFLKVSKSVRFLPQEVLEALKSRYEVLADTGQSPEEESEEVGNATI